jgi:transposase
LLTEEEPGATREEVEAESRREPVSSAPPRKRQPHPGRKPLPESLPRVEKVIACQANCAHCGGETRVIGYDLSEVLDREPAKWFARVTKREKRSCGKCSGVQMPELTPRIVDKGLASDRVVVETVVAKYCLHLPLYRQEAILEREAGVEISRATLDGWSCAWASCFSRWPASCAQVCGADRIYRPMKRSCQCRCTTTAARITRPICGSTAPLEARGWSIFSLGRGREGPAKFLKDWNGILQTDGYQAYDQVGGPGVVHVGCWVRYLDTGVIQCMFAKNAEHPGSVCPA